MTYELKFETEAELDAEVKRLAADTGQDYVGAMRMVYESSPEAAEAVDGIMAAEEPTTLAGEPGETGFIALDPAGHAMLPPGEDVDALIHDPVAASREWRAIRACGPQNPYASTDEGRAAFEQDRRAWLELAEPRSRALTIQADRLEEERRAENNRRANAETQAYEARRKRADDDRLAQEAKARAEARAALHRLGGGI